MPGMGAIRGKDGAKADGASARSGIGGISGEETSAVGGAGRKGGPGEGPDMAPYHCMNDMELGGEATTGTMGYGSGYGKTFGK